MPFLLTLLGLGKSILGFGLSLTKALFDWAQQNPLLALAIAVDIVLVAGCFWGYQQHRNAVDLQGKLNTSEGVVKTLTGRLRQYSDALAHTQQELVDTINQSNAAIDKLKKAADEQLAKSQDEASRYRKQRDAYWALAQKEAQAGRNCGTAEARIACEEKLNGDFIKEVRKAK